MDKKKQQAVEFIRADPDGLSGGRSVALSFYGQVTGALTATIYRKSRSIRQISSSAPR